MMKANSNLPEPNIQIDKRVAQFVMIRDEIEAIEERHRQELKPFIKAKDRLTGELLEFLDSNGLKSAKTAAGAIRISVRYTGVCVDPDQFMDFVFEHNLRDLIDRRANGAACRDYAEEHDGVLPPGVKINSFRTVGVTKS